MRLRYLVSTTGIMGLSVSCFLPTSNVFIQPTTPDHDDDADNANGTNDQTDGQADSRSSKMAPVKFEVERLSSPWLERRELLHIVPDKTLRIPDQ